MHNRGIHNEELSANFFDPIHGIRRKPTNNISDVPSLASEYYQWNFGLLIEHILIRYHRFSKVAIARICDRLIDVLDTPRQGIANEHLHRFPVLTTSREWLHCMEYMEQEVFAYITALAEVDQTLGELPTLIAVSLSDAITIINETRNRFKAAATVSQCLIKETIDHSSIDFSLLEVDDLLSRVLKELEVQSFLEESVLFPRALRLERETTERAATIL